MHTRNYTHLELNIFRSIDRIMLNGKAVLFCLPNKHKRSRPRLCIFSNTGLISSHVIRAWADAESRTTSIDQGSSIKVHKRRPLLCHSSEWHLICRFSFWQWLTAVSLRLCRACKSRGDTRQNVTTQSDSCPNSTMLSTPCEVVAIIFGSRRLCPQTAPHVG